MKKLIVDIDNTICITIDGDYANSQVKTEVVNKLLEYKENGFEIILFTSRNMRTHENNIGKINLHTIPVIVNWLEKFNIPCDELHVGKPWCGHDGFYIDDKAIRPDEFTNLTYTEIEKIIKK
jgi:capsule biosynthesis phosphatase